MTVKEALKELKKYPKDAEIYLVKDWAQECDDQGCFTILYRLRDITDQQLVVEDGMDWKDVTEVLLDCEEEPAQPKIDNSGL